MDVSSIKGLTMPITMVIPPRALTEGIDQTSEEDLSLFLVQITRAQYMNVILEDPRKIDEYKDVSILNYPDPKNPHEKGIKSENVSSWLDDILNNSGSLEKLFLSLEIDLLYLCLFLHAIAPIMLTAFSAIRMYAGVGDLREIWPKYESFDFISSNASRTFG